MTTGRINQIAIHGAGLSDLPFALLPVFSAGSPDKREVDKPTLFGDLLSDRWGPTNLSPKRCVFANRILLQTGSTLMVSLT